MYGALLTDCLKDQSLTIAMLEPSGPFSCIRTTQINQSSPGIPNDSFGKIQFRRQINVIFNGPTDYSRVQSIVQW